ILLEPATAFEQFIRFYEHKPPDESRMHKRMESTNSEKTRSAGYLTNINRRTIAPIHRGLMGGRGVRNVRVREDRDRSTTHREVCNGVDTVPEYCDWRLNSDDTCGGFKRVHLSVGDYDMDCYRS